MESPIPKSKPRPPRSLFAIGDASLPAEVDLNGIRYTHRELFKHDFFAITGLYADPAGNLVVLKIQRTYPFYKFPMRWCGRIVARHEAKIYRKLQGIRGIPNFLGRVGDTGLMHEYIPGSDLHAGQQLTPQFFEELATLFTAIHYRNIAYVDANKRENILYGADGKPWLIDFQISFYGGRRNFFTRWFLRRCIRADWYHYHKHKTRFIPKSCTPEEFAKARTRGTLHRFHRFCTRPIIWLRRKFLARYDLAKTR